MTVLEGIEVTGPCELLVMYNLKPTEQIIYAVTGPCELLVMYNICVGW